MQIKHEPELSARFGEARRGASSGGKRSQRWELPTEIPAATGKISDGQIMSALMGK